METRERALFRLLSFLLRASGAVLSQAPDTTLDDLDDLLQDDWGSLTPDERQGYEEKAKQLQGSNSAQQRLVRSEISGRKPDVRRKDVASTRAIVQLPFSMKSVQEKLADYCQLSQQPLSRETTFVIGPLGSAPKQGLWLACHGGKLATLNLPCLREATLFRKLKQTYVVPAEELRPPLVVTPSMLARPESWNTLALLKQEKRDLSGLSYVVDPLLTYNGFHLRLLPGGPDQKADVVRKASGVNVSDLGQILGAISCRTSNDAITIEGTRPTSVLELLRQEARRMVQCSPPNCPENVRDSTEDLDKRCLHGNAVCAAFFDLKGVASA